MAGGEAKRSGLLQSGDCILSVNGHSLAGLSKSEALEVLREAPGNTVTLHLVRSRQAPITATVTTPPTTTATTPPASPSVRHPADSTSQSYAPAASERAHEGTKTSPRTQNITVTPSRTARLTITPASNASASGRLPTNPAPPYLYSRRSLRKPSRDPERGEFLAADDRQPRDAFARQRAGSGGGWSQHPSGIRTSIRSRSPEHSRVESWCISLQWSSPPPYFLPPQETAAKFKTPKSKWQRGDPACTNPRGRVLTFTDPRSTLPRRIVGGRRGLHLVELRKGTGFLGMQLREGEGPPKATPIVVKAVLRGGPAWKTGKVMVGDEIVEVNGIGVEGRMELKRAVWLMRRLPKGRVSLILRRSEGGKEAGEEMSPDGNAPSREPHCRKRLFEGCEFS